MIIISIKIRMESQQYVTGQHNALFEIRYVHLELNEHKHDSVIPPTEKS